MIILIKKYNNNKIELDYLVNEVKKAKIIANKRKKYTTIII